MSDQPTKVLIVIAPRIKLTESTIGRIEEAGYIVVRGLPSDFTVMGQPPLLEPMVLQAALTAIGEHTPDSDTQKGNGVRSRFGRNLARALGYGNYVVMK